MSWLQTRGTSHCVAHLEADGCDKRHPVVPVLPLCPAHAPRSPSFLHTPVRGPWGPSQPTVGCSCRLVTLASTGQDAGSRHGYGFVCMSPSAERPSERPSAERPSAERPHCACRNGTTRPAACDFQSCLQLCTSRGGGGGQARSRPPVTIFSPSPRVTWPWPHVSPPPPLSVCLSFLS